MTHAFDASAELLERGAPEAPPRTTVSVQIGSEQISVVDDAGGIDPERARREVFRLGDYKEECTGFTLHSIHNRVRRYNFVPYTTT